MVESSSLHSVKPGAWRARGGFALPLTLLVLAFLAIVGVGAVTSAGLGRNSSRSLLASEEAFFAADAGVNRWLANWPGSTVDTMTAGTRVALGTTTLPGGAHYRAWVDRYDSGSGEPAWALTVTGGTRGYGGGQRTLRVWRLKDGGGSWPAGILAKGKVVFSGGGFSDAYDSRVGPYGGANVAPEGSVRTNGNLDLSGGSVIRGNATVGGLVNDHTLVMGSITEGASPPITIPNIPCPAGGYTPAADVPLAPTTSTYIDGKLVVRDTLYLPGGTYYFGEISAGGGAVLAIYPGSSILIYVAGKTVSGGGGGFNNRTMDPSKFTIIACGTNSLDQSVTGGGGAYFTVYAPNSKVTVSGGGDLWGAIAGNTISITGGSRVHVDKGLVGGSGGGGTINGAWSQLSF